MYLQIPWTEEPGGLQSMGSLRVGHHRTTSLSFLCIGEGNGNPLQCSCLENPRDEGAWWAAVYGVILSRTQLERLSSQVYERLAVECSEPRVWSSFLRQLMTPRIMTFPGPALDLCETGSVKLPGRLNQVATDSGKPYPVGAISGFYPSLATLPLQSSCPGQRK